MSSDFDKIKCEIQNLLKNVISKRRRLYVKKHRSYNLFHIILPPILRSFLWQLYDIVFRF